MLREKELEIIKSVQQGNTAAFSEFVDLYKDSAFSLCVRICGNRDDAADVCQDAFVKAFRGISSFRGDSGISTWLFRIVYNTAISFLRNRKVKTLSIDNLNESVYFHEDNNLIWEDEENKIKQKLIREIIDELPELDRTIVILYYLMEHSINQISVITSNSESSIKVRLHRVRSRMFAEITKRLKLQSIH